MHVRDHRRHDHRWQEVQRHAQGRLAAILGLASIAAVGLASGGVPAVRAETGADVAARSVPPRPAWPLLFEWHDESADHRFSLGLRDLTVAEALRFCLRGTGLQLVDEDTLSMPARASLDSVTVAEALDALARTHDLTWRVEGTQLVVSRREEASFHLGYIAEAEATFWEDLETNLKTLRSPEGTLVLHPRSGLIHVIDRPSVVRRIGAFVAAIGRDLGRQVNIESKLVEVALDEGMEVGIDWTTFAYGWDGFSGNTTSRGLAELGTTSGGGVFQMGLIRTGRLELLLEMLETRGNVRVISRPRLAAMGNEPAVFRVTENIPYYVQDVFTTQGSDPYIQYRLEFREAGVVLEVLSHAAADGSITLKVHPSVSSLTGYTAALPNLPPQPIVDLRETKTTVRMREGETLVIGGLLHEREEHNRRGVPFLSRLPLLGALFRRDAASTKKQELVIFLTPGILADGAGMVRADRSRCLLWPRPFAAIEPRERLAAYAHARGVDAFLAGESGEALSWGRRAVALAPNRPEPRFNLGLYLAASGQANEARTAWGGVAIRPEMAGAAESNLRALALWEGTASPDSLVRFAPSAGAEPPLVAAQALNESSRLEGLGRGREARDVLEQAAAALPRQAGPWRLLLEQAMRPE